MYLFINKKYSRLVISVLFMMSIVSCQSTKSEAAMFKWINTMTTCPKISKEQYPRLDPELQAMYDKALMLDRSDEVVKPETITALYKEAAEKGHWPSMHNLAVSYYQGYGIEQDEAKALYWYQQIEKLDIPDSYTNMAIVYRIGIGVEPDEKKAVAYMDKAAQLGDPDAQFMVGKYLYSPLGRKPDAYKVLACAVEQGHKEAAFELALHYKVDKDFDMAYKIYRKGAKLGSRSCLNALKYAYAHTPKRETFGLKKDTKRSDCLWSLRDELRKNPDLTFPDLDERCPANVEQPLNRD